MEQQQQKVQIKFTLEIATSKERQEEIKRNCHQNSK